MDRKLMVAEGDNAIIPSLDGFSAGQASLFSIFMTILRYADEGGAGKPTSAIEGLVLIDEADAHLHADLQHDTLPKLIEMFPRVQFIISAHAPLFPLGMEKRFGEDGYSLIELPTGLRITAERFTEFSSSFAYLQATKTFEGALATRVGALTRPTVLCEGETDPPYLRKAAELLGFDQLLNSVDFDWVGQKAVGGADGGGKDNLDHALRVLKNNPGLHPGVIVLLYDADARKPSKDFPPGLFVRGLPDNPTNTVCVGGVENMLPKKVFQKKFYSRKVKISGGTKITTETLDKAALCEAICQENPSDKNFENFRPILEELSKLLNVPLPVTE